MNIVDKNRAILDTYRIMEERIDELEKEMANNDEPILHELFKVEKECLIKKLEKIQSAVMNLESVPERRVIWLHYIGELKNGKRERLFLWQIAEKMNYSFDWAKKANASALKNIKFN